MQRYVNITSNKMSKNGSFENAAKYMLKVLNVDIHFSIFRPLVVTLPTLNAVLQPLNLSQGDERKS